MKNFAKSKGKRITAALLCAVMCIMSLPLSAFAFTAEEGKTVDAYYGERYFGSDGDYYYSPESHQYIAYDENGNTSLHSASGVHRRTKLMIKDSSGSRQIMCIESGIDYNAGGTYSSVNGKNSSYFQNLPTTAQYGIMLTSVYGWRPGTTAPISGTNEDDFSMATQTILWEYQQQLRTSPTTLKANSYGIPADTYYQCIKGRPAEKCYDWLLTQMQSHATIPSFASNKSSSATTYTLKYKVDADFPDNKLTGATFEVYQDNNADGKPDDGDTLIGTLAESEAGIYEMKYLLYGHYLIKETKAPDGFLLDTGIYPVFIETDGMTYSVENKAGVGFINEAMKGNLKIVKTSSDGKVEGFSFRITGANGYEVTLKTDENGEIFIEGLRIGEYTVSEVADEVSTPYSRPADKKANVMTDSTTIVEMHNVVIDTPKTGDNSKLGLWLALLGASAAGIGVTVYAGVRKKKKEDSE